MSFFLTVASAYNLPDIVPCDKDVPAAYEAMFPIPEAERWDTMFAVSAGTDPVLTGKSILFFGDSLTAGYGLDDYQQSWSGMLETQYGMEVTCCSVSGATFGVSDSYGYHAGGCYAPICQRELPEGDFDMIFVQGTGNDWMCEIPVGTDPESRDITCLYGAINVTLDRIQEAHPDALLVCSTSWNSTGAYNCYGLTAMDYNEVLLEVCAARGVACFEACDVSVSGIDGNSGECRLAYFLKETDYWHLNPAGHALYLPTIAGWIREMLVEDLYVGGFLDVPVEAWYSDAVDYALAQGITNGTSETEFSPNMIINRSMMVTLLYRAAGSPDVTGLENPFPDVPETAFYRDAVIWASDTGLTTGVGDGTFAPERQLTRQELAVFLYRFSGVDGSQLPERLHYFPDGDQVMDFAKEAMNWIVYSDIMHGNGEGMLAPGAVADRSQTVQLLMNYFETDIEGCA